MPQIYMYMSFHIIAYVDYMRIHTVYAASIGFSRDSCITKRGFFYAWSVCGLQRLLVTPFCCCFYRTGKTLLQNRNFFLCGNAQIMSIYSRALFILISWAVTVAAATASPTEVHRIIIGAPAPDAQK